MAKDGLNKLVDDYFKSIDKVKAENITIDMVKKYLDVNDTNYYGGVAHAIVNYSYDKEKILKTIELLLEMGLDPNYTAEATGYTFIHLALYGYTDDSGRDISYSTEFIVSLIEMAIKKGFNVNIKDDDDDTIVDTAIASEVYTGSIMPIISALGPKFCLYPLEKNLDALIVILDKYLTIANKEKDDVWWIRLKKEKDVIIDSVKNGNKGTTELSAEKPKADKKIESGEELLAQKQELDKKLDKLIDSLTLDNLKQREILAIKSEYADLNRLLGKDKIDLAEIENRINNKISLLLESRLKNIVTKPTLKLLNDFITLMKRFPFYKSSIDVNAAMANYKRKLQEYENRANAASSLSAINQVRASLSELLEENLKAKLNKILDDKIKEIERLLANLNQISDKNNALIKFLKRKGNALEYQRDTITLEQINALIASEQSRYSSLVALVNASLNKKLNTAIAPYQKLVEQGLIPKLEIELNVLDTPSSKGEKQKVKDTK